MAREFSQEGAVLFISERRLEPVWEIDKEIRPSNGRADTAEVDALNEKAVTAYLDRVMKQAGRIDIVFNAVGPQPGSADLGKFAFPAVAFVISK